MRLRHIILFLLMAVSVTPIRAGISTDYLLGGRLTLKNGRIDKCYFEGGFARAFETSATTDRFVFYYYNQDHLGNNREVVDIKGRIHQVTNYYPFGAPFADEKAIKGESLQPYKYNGKELDLMHGLNTYDYGARQYDPILLKWDRVDQLAEKDYPTSPYVYCGNNPVNRVDKDGRIWDTVLDLAFVAYDAAEAAYQYCTTGHVSNTTKAALGADALAAAVPGLTGTGLAVRTGTKAAEVTKRAEKAIQSASKSVAKTNRAESIAKGIPEKEIGPSGLPKIHNVIKPNRKKASDAARNNNKSNTKPVKHSSDKGQKEHFHPTRDGEKMSGKDNIHYVNNSSKKNPE